MILCTDTVEARGQSASMSPVAFEVRDAQAAVPNLQAGVWAKVGTETERFWVKVRCGRGDGMFVGTVDN